MTMATYKAGVDKIMTKLQSDRSYFDMMIQELVDIRVDERISQFLDQIKDPMEFIRVWQANKDRRVRS